MGSTQHPPPPSSFTLSALPSLKLFSTGNAPTESVSYIPRNLCWKSPPGGGRCHQSAPVRPDTHGGCTAGAPAVHAPCAGSTARPPASACAPSRPPARYRDTPAASRRSASDQNAGSARGSAPAPLSVASRKLVVARTATLARHQSGHASRLITPHRPLDLAHAQSQPFSRLARPEPGLGHRLDDLEPVHLAHRQGQDSRHPGGSRQCLRVDILADVRQLAVSNCESADPMILPRSLRGLSFPLAKPITGARSACATNSRVSMNEVSIVSDSF